MNGCVKAKADVGHIFIYTFTPVDCLNFTELQLGSVDKELLLIFL